MSRRVDTPAVRTGIEGNFLVLSDELIEACSRVARGEGLLAEREHRLLMEDPGSLDDACRRLVVNAVPGAREQVGLSDVDADEFVRRCFSLSGGYIQRIMFKSVREAARAYASPVAPRLPQTKEELLRLWEAANAGEPDMKVDVSRAVLRRSPLFIGDRKIPTCPPEHLEEQLAFLLAFLGDNRIPPLARATAGVHLLWRIHPFRDGNGHLGRMMVRSGLTGSSRLMQVACARLVGDRKRTLSHWCCVCEEGGMDLAQFSRSIIGVVEDAQAMAEKWLPC